MKYCCWLLLAIFTSSNFAYGAPTVGRKSAQKYFKKREPQAVAASADRYMMLHFGSFVDSAAWNWKVDDRQDDVANMTLGVSYRMGEWTNSMDLLLRIDFQEYEILDRKPLKMSIMPMITFPDAASQFPVYFGLGAGVGVFFKQNENVSNLSFDYQLVAGLRFMNLVGSTGAFIETGLKNHIHLLSQGQFNGVFVAVGAVFAF